MDNCAMQKELSKYIELLLNIKQEIDALPDKDSGSISEIIAKSRLVDESWYLSSYPDVASTSISATMHYAIYGYKEGRVPAPELAAYVPTISADTPSGFAALEAYLDQMLTRLLAANESRLSNSPAIIQQGSFESLYDMPLYVHWSITSMCNYACSYCSFRYGEDKRVDRAKLTPYQKLANAVDNLARMNRPLYELVLLGGEPTVHPRLPELLLHAESRLKGRLKMVTIVTNGSRDAAWFNQLAEQAKRLHILITISIHPEQASPAHIFKLIEQLDPALDINFVLMMHPEKMDIVSTLHTQLCKLRPYRPFNLAMQPIYAPPDFAAIDPRYPEDFFAWRNEMQGQFMAVAEACSLPNVKKPSIFHTFWKTLENGQPNLIVGGDRSVIHQHGLLNFHNMHCVCGTNLARIEDDGMLRGGVCGYSSTAINMYDRDAIKDSSFIHIAKCGASFCTCNDNDINMKFRDRYEAEKYAEFAKLKQDRLLQESLAPQAPL